MAAPGSINLLPRSEFETSFWGKFLSWALTTGRYMVILTELLVIIAFISRFGLDKQLSDLGDNIAGKKTIIEVSANYEARFRAIQDRLNVSEQLMNTQPQMAETVDLVTSRAVAGVRLTNVTVATGEVSVSGTAATDQAFGSFVARMAAARKWKTLDLTEISSDDALGIKFTMKAKI